MRMSNAHFAQSFNDGALLSLIRPAYCGWTSWKEVKQLAHPGGGSSWKISNMDKL